MIESMSVGSWFFNHALDGFLSSLIAGGLGAWVVILATNAGRDQWKQDRHDRDRADRQRALDEFRSELGSVYVAVEQQVSGHILPTTNADRAPELARLSARLVILQLAAERGRPQVEGDVSRLTVLMDHAITKDRKDQPIFTTPVPGALTQVRDGLLELLRASVSWTVD